MESQPVSERVFVFTWRVTQNSGVSYIRIPKEFASLRGISKGDIVSLSIWSIEKPKKVEKK